MDFRAVVFVPALAGCAITGFVFALFAAHYYLTVLESTGSGAKRVAWPSEPFVDHFWKPFYLAWLMGLWLGPAWLLGRTVAADAGAAWPRFAVPLVVLWVCYPVSQLSSLGGPTIWLPLHPGVLAKLTRRPVVAVGFLGLSALTLALFGVALQWTFFTGGFVWLFLGSPVLVLAWLVYARLLGRVAYSLMFTKSYPGRRKKKRARNDAEGGEAVRRPSAGGAEEPEPEAAFAQPSDLPPVVTPDEGPLTGYDVKFDAPPPVRKKRVVAEVAAPHPEPAAGTRVSSDEDDDTTPYGVNAAEVQPEDRAPPVVIKPSADEMRLLDRSDAPRPVKQVWTGEVFAFLGQPETWVVVVTLSAMCVVFGGMVRVARTFNPVPGGG
jgi:hypothetical protein